MWIRSQDKKTLTKVTRLFATRRGKIQNLPTTGIEDDYDILGEYKSEKRAIEILDIIMNQIGMVTESTVSMSNEVIKRHFVFQMPEE